MREERDRSLMFVDSLTWYFGEGQYGCHPTLGVLLLFPSSLGWCCYLPSPFWEVLLCPRARLCGADFSRCLLWVVVLIYMFKFLFH